MRLEITCVNSACSKTLEDSFLQIKTISAKERKRNKRNWSYQRSGTPDVTNDQVETKMKERGEVEHNGKKICFLKSVFVNFEKDVGITVIGVTGMNLYYCHGNCETNFFGGGNTQKCCVATKSKTITFPVLGPWNRIWVMSFKNANATQCGCL